MWESGDSEQYLLLSKTNYSWATLKVEAAGEMPMDGGERRHHRLHRQSQCSGGHPLKVSSEMQGGNRDS
jgi:hypothetical protein